MNKMKHKKGFTLTELIIVIVIIGILASVLIPSLTNYIKKAKISNQVSNATNMSKELAAYVVANEIDESLSTSMVISLVEDWGYSLDGGIEGYSYWYDASKNRIHYSKTANVLTDGAILAAGESNFVREIETLNVNHLNLRFIDQSKTIYRELIDTVYNLPSLGNNNAQGMDDYLTDMINKLSSSAANTVVKNFFEEYKTTETAYISSNGSFICSTSEIKRLIIEEGTTKIEKIDELQSANLTIQETVIIPESVTDIAENALGDTELKVVASSVIENDKVQAISTNVTVVKAQVSIITEVVDMDENDYKITYKEKMVKLSTGEERKLKIDDPIPNEWKNLVDSIYYIPEITLLNNTGKFNNVDMSKTNFSSHIVDDKVDYKLLLVDSNYVVYRLNNIAYLTDLNVSLYNSGERYETIESMSNKQISIDLPKDFSNLANYKNTKLVIEYKVGFAEYEERLINFTKPYYVMSNNVKYDANTYIYEISYQDLCEKKLVDLNIIDKNVLINSENKIANSIHIENIKLIDTSSRVLVEKKESNLCINYYDENRNLLYTEYCPNGISNFAIDYQNDESKEHYHRVWRSMDNEEIYFEIGKTNTVLNELNLQYSWEIDKFYITYYGYKNSYTKWPETEAYAMTYSHLYPYGTVIADTIPNEIPSVRGLEFIGWDIEEGAILTENTVILAKFSEPEYKLVLHLNYEGAEETTETHTIKENGKSSTPYLINELGIYTFNFTVNNAFHYTIINYNPVREGYVVDYWCYFPEGTTDSLYKISVGTKKQLNVFNGVGLDNVEDNTFNLYAIWKVDKVSFTLDFGEELGSTNVTSNKLTSLYYQDYASYLPNVEGKVIAYWTKNEETTKKEYLYNASEGDVFHAIWADSKTVTIDWNCEEFPDNTVIDGWYTGQKCYFSSSSYRNITTCLNGNLPTREGYVLLGISSSETATTPDRYTIKVTDNITVYAVWAELYEVKLDLNFEGCDEPTIIDNLYCNQSITISLTSNSQYYPTRDGYIFMGWSTDKNAEKGSSSIKAISNGVVYYGIWKKAITVTFNYVLNGLPDSEECNTHYEGYSGTYSPKTVIGYTFMGWTTDLNNPSDLNKTIIFKEGITYYAVWQYNIV